MLVVDRIWLRVTCCLRFTRKWSCWRSRSRTWRRETASWRWRIPFWGRPRRRTRSPSLPPPDRLQLRQRKSEGDLSHPISWWVVHPFNSKCCLMAVWRASGHYLYTIQRLQHRSRNSYSQLDKVLNDNDGSMRKSVVCCQSSTTRRSSMRAARCHISVSK